MSRWLMLMEENVSISKERGQAVEWLFYIDSEVVQNE
jgi:hypothetical protein